MSVGPTCAFLPCHSYVLSWEAVVTRRLFLHWTGFYFSFIRPLVACDEWPDLTDCQHSCVGDTSEDSHGHVSVGVWCPWHRGCLLCSRAVRTWRSPGEQTGDSKDPVAPGLVHASLQLSVPVRAVHRQTPALRGGLRGCHSAGAAGLLGWSCCPAPAPAHLRNLPRDQPGGLAAPQRTVPALGLLGVGSLPGSKHVWGGGAGTRRCWDMHGGCPLPYRNWAAPEHRTALLQPRWWSMA